jgi:hypothetical protein
VNMDDIEDPMTATYPDNHPMRMLSGRMPHEASEDDWVAYMRSNGMSERAYWISVGIGEDYVERLASKDKTKPTSALTADQRGWARLYFPGHFAKRRTRWVIPKDKPSKPRPAFDVKFHPYRDLKTTQEQQ